MSKGKGIFVSCDEANHFCDKNQYKEATFFEKVKLNLHVLYCKACRGYSMRNAKLTKLTKKVDFNTLNKADTIKEEEKNAMKERLKQKMME